MPLSDFPPELGAWVDPPSGTIHIIFSPAYEKWLSDTLKRQHADQALVYRLLRLVAADVEASSGKPPVLLDILQEEVVALTVALENVLADLSAPRALDIQIEGRRPTAMVAVNDVSFTAHVSAKDAAGRTAVDTGPFSWSVDPPDAAKTDADPANPDDTAHVRVTDMVPDASGNQPSFTLAVSDGTLSGSLQCEPVAGGATSLSIAVDSA